MSALDAKGGGGGGISTNTSSEVTESTLAEVMAGRERNYKCYQAGIEKAKQTCIQTWKVAEDDSMTESEFIDQLNRVVDDGQSQPSDHFAIRLFLKRDYKALNDAMIEEENRLTAVQRVLDAELLQANDGILRRVKEIVPGYERVTKEDVEDVSNVRLLSVNKFLEEMLLHQAKFSSELNQRLDLFEDILIHGKAFSANLEAKSADTRGSEDEVDHIIEEVKVAIAQVIESMKENERSYRDGMKEAKQNCINEWRTTDDESISESSFEAQLDQAIGKCESSDHFAVKIFMKGVSSKYNTLTDAFRVEERRLNEIRKGLELKVNAAAECTLRHVQEIVPGYERVLLGEEEYDNMLRINKLLESMLFQQAKLKEEIERRFEVIVQDGLKKAAIAAEKAEKERLIAKIEADRLAAAAAVEKAEKDRLAKLAARTRQLSFSSQGDTNGVLHFIGTKGGTVPYANPNNAAGGVVASARSVGDGTVDAIVGRDNARFYTSNEVNSHIKVDLGVGRSLILNHYTFKHGFHRSNHYIRSWRLEGSNDDSTWVTIREHNNDTTINDGYAPGSWPINLTATITTAAAAGGNPMISYRYFRIIQTGPDSSGYHHLMLCRLELYGKYSWGESTAY